MNKHEATGDFSLIPRPSHQLTAPLIDRNRILDEMVEETLALGRDEAVARTARFRIGNYAWCEPDYRQILLWAEALKIEPITVTEKLIAGKSLSKIADGRILSLWWDLVELPLSDFRFIKGITIEFLILRYFNSPEEQLVGSILDPVRYPMRHSPVSPNEGLREITLFRPSFRILSCVYCGIQVLTVSGSHELTKLQCAFNKMKKLALFDVPSLSSLSCHNNQLAELDLSHVPNLTWLSCRKNRITELDIRPLLSLQKLDYDAGSTRLIQRPDQNF